MTAQRSVATSSIIIALIGAAICHAATPTFHAPLDGDLSGGEVADAEIAFDQGIEGQAATIGVAGDREFRCTWDAEGRIGAEQGAISLWVKPLDWDATNPHHQIFFSATGEDAVLHMYRYNDVGAQSGYSRKLMFLYGPSRRDADGNWQWTIASSAEAREWEAGQWHHIACTWDAETLVLYLDGQVAEARPVAAPPATGFDSFGIGGAHSWQNTGGTSLVDDLRIFDAPLTAAEIYAEWEAHGGDAPAAAEGDFGMDYVYTDIEARTLHLGLRQPYPLLRGEPINAEIRLRADGGEVALERTFSEAEFTYQVVVPMVDLSPGEYAIGVRYVAEDGTVLDELEVPYRKYQPGPPPWEGNTIGVTDEVPAPWTEVTVADSTIACWGREYEIGPTGLPAQITSQGTDLLHSPMRISATVAGEAVSASQSAVECATTSAAEAAFTADSTIGEIPLRCEGRVEYDGFAWFEVTVGPLAEAEVSALTVEIPLRKDAAGLRNLGRYRLEGTGAAPESGTYHKHLGERPIFWLGNEEMGLQWVAETLEAWRCEDFARSLEVTAEADRVVARLHVIDTPTVLREPLTIAFGLQATPVRPKPEGWRKWRLRPWRGPRPEFNIRPWFTEWTDLFNYPRPSHVVEERIQQRRAFRAERDRVLSYLSLTHATPYSPEFRYYGERWRQTPQERVLKHTALDPQTRIWANYTICARDASYRDFYMAMLGEAVEEQDITGGLYFDQARPEMCENPRHGCGWVDANGERRPTFNVLGTRELAKRIYVMMKDRHPDALIAHHMSGEITMPVNAFSDILIDGENLTGAVGLAGNYYDALPPDTFRAEYMPHQWGPIPALLPQHARSASILKGREAELHFYEAIEAQKPINHLIGLVAAHDALIWPAWEVRPNALWAAMDEFGWDDEIEFLPYWDNAELIEVLSPDAEDLLVSAFRRPGRVMLVPLNNSDRDVTLRLRLDLAGLGLPREGRIPLRDAYHGGEFAIVDGAAEIPLPARGFRMLVSP